MTKLRGAAGWGEAAFAKVYSRYLRPLYAYLLKRVRNHHDAEDLANQVLTKVLSHLEPREADSPQMAAWLFRSARNMSSNLVRSRKYVATISIEEVDEPVDVDSPQEAALEAEAIDEVTRAVERLPEEQRRAVLLRFVHELSHAEIADELGRTEGSARVLIHRTLADLRKAVG